MIKRDAKEAIKENLKINPAVLLYGSRQSGKSTLAKDLGGIYFDLEKTSDWNKVDNEWNELEKSKKLIIFDEAQNRPELFQRLRSSIDEDRKRNGRFLLLGSIAPSLMSNVSQSLAGRISLFELSTLNISELGMQNFNQLWLKGGYPDGGIIGERRFPKWQQDFLETMSSRDLPNLGLSAKPKEIYHLFELLASSHGNIWNASEIGKALGNSRNTINKYVDFMEEIFLIRKIRPYNPRNDKKRFTKSPKIYLRDSGLLHTLLGITSKEELYKSQKLGLSFEGFVIEQIHSFLKNKNVLFDMFFLRTSDLYELDLILKIKTKIYAVEIKLTSSPSTDSIKRFRTASDLAGADFRALIASLPDKDVAQNKNEMIGNLCSFFEITRQGNLESYGFS